MYHSDCYEKANGKKCARCTTQFDGYCEYCRGFIPAGTTGINWRRRWQGQSNGKPLPEQPTITDAPATPAASATVLPAQDMTEVMGLLKALENRLTTTNTYVGMLASRVENLENRTPMTVEVKVCDAPAVDVGLAHKLFPKLLKALAAKRNVYLWGGSGGGKSTACVKAAKALGVEYYYTSAIVDSFTLIGFRDATGQTVRTPFREAWENGGVFVVEEGDSSDPVALLAFTTALAADTMAFPDGMIKKHPNFRCVFNANTVGQGADSHYNGRNRLDGAFRQRFVFLEWEYDEALERAMTHRPEWAKTVQRVRRAVKDRGIMHLVTPHHTANGAALLDQGFSEQEVAEATILVGLTPEQKAQVWS